MKMFYNQSSTLMSNILHTGSPGSRPGTRIQEKKKENPHTLKQAQHDETIKGIQIIQ